MVRVVVSGKEYEVTREEVIAKMQGVKPKAIRAWQVEVNGVTYPIKQVMETALGIPVLAFGSVNAFRLLSKLGFEVKPASNQEK